jgi:hypothetical protein
MNYTLPLAALALTLASPALATGKVRCNVAKADMLPQTELVAKLEKEGWQVRKAKPDGGCYEVYGTMPDGARVEAYFDPKSFETLYIEQRGKVIFRKD